MNNTIIIWGAGKIGRGFIADLFHEAGYSILFVDKNESLVERLNAQKEFTVYKFGVDGSQDQTIVSGYTALHTSQKNEIISALRDGGRIALSVLPESLAACAKEILNIVRQLAASNTDTPLDIIVCANMIDPSEKLKAIIEPHLSELEKVFYDKNVGLVDTLISRIAMNSKDTEKEPLAVVTNGYPVLPMDKTAFKGEVPKLDGIILIDNMHAQAIRKFYTYNTLHAIYGYLGFHKGYTHISECKNDAEIMQTAAGALEEVGEALIAVFGFSQQEMADWNKNAFCIMNNPVLEDTVERVGANPIRKLDKQDRLTGPVLLCKDNGIWPYYLTKGIAHAFLFAPKSDENAVTVKEYADYYGIKEAAKKYCGLDREPELLQLIKRHYDRALHNEDAEDAEKVSAMKKAYHLGFMSEKKYKGCAQCTLDAFFRLTGHTNEMLFQSASGFSGGMAISGDGVCGGYSGGLMYMGSLVGRRWQQMIDNGDKEAQYMSYTMSQRLRDCFLETYGSVTCGDVHEQIFGKSYCLRTKAVRNEFEAVGAHTNKCTNVVGTACAYIAEILFDTGYLTTV